MPNELVPKANASVRETFKALHDRWNGQAVAYTSRPLTAALCYDRVIAPHSLLSPTNRRAWLEHFQYGMWLESSRAAHGRYEREIMLSGWRLAKGADRLLEFATVVDSNAPYKEQALRLQELTGARVIPVLEARTEYDQTFKKGSREVLVASLSELDVVDEDQLSLNQVLEFRCDQESAIKYRRLLSWLDAKVVGMTETEVIETLHQRLDDYNWALKKHGIKTALGIVSETLDGRYLLGASAVVAASLTAGFPVLGMFAGEGIVVGKLAVRVASDWLDLKDRERGEYSEVAWLYQIEKRFHR